MTTPDTQAETPRTDAVHQYACAHQNYQQAARSFGNLAAQLERDLAAATARAEKAEADRDEAMLRLANQDDEVIDLRAKLAACERDAQRLADADVLYHNEGDRRQWYSGGTWVYPGQQILLVDAIAAQGKEDEQS